MAKVASEESKDVGAMNGGTEVADILFDPSKQVAVAVVLVLAVCAHHDRSYARRLVLVNRRCVSQCITCWSGTAACCFILVNYVNSFTAEA
ncbi:hypothetical protein BOTBODRAFT_346874 [Botryobasidium botryosum FD-172 SS1]|uniref:Uncharacterized protein n=1 Tax=Botryobasidium botryosum (strain FD-172 SS1) TaxID=930990 RepID=A0A067MRP0_BOTB1|nr:hypothetical protein BOTBODRAFT_346874 [Botryobasidium botryosum FD-172 SS1]